MNKTNSARVIVISGPSGVGKGTVIEGLRARRTFGFSVSHTTRPPRTGEIDGVNYHFVTPEAFQALEESGAMLETTCYQGNRYGTSCAAIADALAAGQDVLLDIEVEGAANIRRAYPEAVEIFLLPPSMAELERRLRGRKSEPEEVIRGRIARAREEITRAREFDYILVNHRGESERVVDEIEQILRAHTHRACACTALVEALLEEETDAQKCAD